MKSSRREFLTLSGAGLLATAIPGSSYSAEALSFDYMDFTFDLGMASYTFRRFNLEETLAMTKRVGISRIAFKDFHLPLDASDELIASTIQKCDNEGITCYGAGVIYMTSRDEVDNAFEYARKAKLKVIIGVPEHELLAYTENKVKEYDIKLAIHNHGPGDKRYPSAESAYTRIQNMDPRMGLCIDIGHTKRINRNPEQDLVDFFDRVFDIHIKDVTAANEKGSTCEIGRGVIDIPLFLKTVVEKKYTGTLSLEYEKDAGDPLPGAAESIGYVKGVLSNLK
jgi:sugar phosphate isomerase/epimerase